MNKDDIRKLIREGLEEEFNLHQEGSDGNYMAKQNIGAILKAAEIVNEHIKEDEEQARANGYTLKSALNSK